MKSPVCIAAAVGLALPLALSGCALFPTTRHLPVPKAPPGLVRVVSPEDLVKQLDDRWETLQSLSVKVQIKASIEKTAQGVTVDEPAIPAIILMRKPEFLTVYGEVPVLQMEMFEMVSDGKDFTLYIKPKGEAFEGTNSAKGTSKNPWENLRPPFFFNAMVVRGVNPGNHYFVTSDTVTMEDPTKKHLYSVPEYILNINRVDPGSQKETAVRVITFHRSDMLPYAQDIYDSEGNLETHVTYGAYQNFEGVQFPSTISIRNPIAGIELALTVENVHENLKLNDDQFKVQLPNGIKIEHLQ